MPYFRITVSISILVFINLGFSKKRKKNLVKIRETTLVKMKRPRIIKASSEIILPDCAQYQHKTQFFVT